MGIAIMKIRYRYRYRKSCIGGHLDHTHTTQFYAVILLVNVSFSDCLKKLVRTEVRIEKHVLKLVRSDVRMKKYVLK